jgi:positive regulator of sigma E activity
MTEGILDSSTSLYILTVLALAVVFIQKIYENDYQFALVTIALTVTILTIAGLYVRKYMNSITN